MKKKLLLSDFADFIAKREGIGKKEADAFVRAFFEVIEQGLLEDRFVKIKGFGTFKLVAVSDRESVNINTGERFQISGHTKVSFMPDTSMKELVNRPFAHFESVDLNDETEVEELDAIDKDYKEEEENEALNEELPVNEEIEPIQNIVAPQTPEVPQTPQSLEEAQTEAAPIPQEPEEEQTEEVVLALEETDHSFSAKTEEDTAEVGETPAETDEPEETPTTDKEDTECIRETEERKASATVGYVYGEVPSSRKHNWWKTAVLFIIVIVLMAISYYAGYFRILCPCNFMVPQAPQQKAVIIQPAKPVSKPAPAQERTAAPKDSTAEQKPAPPATEEIKGDTARQPAPQKAAAPAPTRPKTHKIKVGDNLYRISRKYYGTDKFVDEIIKLNNIGDADNIHLGSTLKLP